MTATKPRLSIVTPCFNAAKTIHTVVESIQRQNCSGVEHIIVDGGSTDGTRDILKEYDGVVLIFEADDGPYDAINKGFAIAQGEILAWLNADDFYLPYTLSAVLDIFETFPDIEWLTSQFPMFADRDGVIVASEKTAGFNQNRALFPDAIQFRQDRTVHAAMQQESTFWRRSLWQRAGAKLNTTYTLAADFELWLRFWQHAEVYALAAPLGCFRWTDEQRSNVHWQEYENQINQILAAHGGGSASVAKTFARRIALLFRGAPQVLLEHCWFAAKTNHVCYNRDMKTWSIKPRYFVIP